MASFDYDVVIIGSGFGGSVAALRAAEKGYRVGVMESGRRWKDEDIPKTQWDLPPFLWQPEAEMYGIQRIEYLYLAERLGVEIHELHEVYDLVPLDGGGFEVHTRHPG